MLMFYRLPSKNGVLDWDCAEAIDVSAMAEALSYIRSHASFPVSTPEARSNTSKTSLLTYRSRH